MAQASLNIVAAPTEYAFLSAKRRDSVQSTTEHAPTKPSAALGPQSERLAAAIQHSVAAASNIASHWATWVCANHARAATFGTARMGNAAVSVEKPCFQVFADGLSSVARHRAEVLEPARKRAEWSGSLVDERALAEGLLGYLVKMMVVATFVAQGSEGQMQAAGLKPGMTELQSAIGWVMEGLR